MNSREKVLLGVALGLGVAATVVWFFTEEDEWDKLRRKIAAAREQEGSDVHGDDDR